MTARIATTANIEIHFTPEERCLRHVRLSIVSFIMVMTENRDLASRIAMVAAELVENAVKYAAGPELQFRLTAGVEGTTTRVRIETENAAKPEHIQELTRLIGEVKKGDSIDAYMRMLRAAPTKSVGTSQLGMARMRYEGQVDLRSEQRGDNRVRVIAEGTHHG